VRESRVVPFSPLVTAETESPEPAVEPDRFRPADAEWPGHWSSPPRAWEVIPEEFVLSGEIRAHIREAIDGLPPAQRAVISLRDLEGWNAQEICNILEISESNQRVLLHRARSKVRAALEVYFLGRAKEKGSP
jgi:RNA polymerase sigma-70 factor (ECF subfamily)